MNLENTVSQQERVAGMLGSLLFFLPILMEKKTEFTVFYMKQSFLLFVANVSLMLISALFWPLRGLVGLFEFIVFILVVFLAWNAWQGKKFSIPGLLENSELLIAKIGIASWFTPGK